jgi:hypothetical protein
MPDALDREIVADDYNAVAKRARAEQQMLSLTRLLIAATLDPAIVTSDARMEIQQAVKNMAWEAGIPIIDIEEELELADDLLREKAESARRMADSSLETAEQALENLPD